MYYLMLMRYCTWFVVRSGGDVCSWTQLLISYTVCLHSYVSSKLEICRVGGAGGVSFSKTL